MSSRKNLQSYNDICKEMYRQLKSGFLDWPLYQGLLGEDSTGGTDKDVYAALCAKGYLTTN